MIALAWGLVRPFAGHIVVVLAVAGGLWWIQHRGYERGHTDATAEFNDRLERGRKAAEADTKAIYQVRDDLVRELEEGFGNFQTVNRTIIQPTLTKEIINETRYSDPACELTDSVRSTLDRQRQAGNAAISAVAGELMPLPQPDPSRSGDGQD